MHLVLGDVPGPGRCTWSQGVYLVLGGVPGPGGCTWSQGGVPGLGGCLGTPPCGQTDRCKNITFATSLRTVKSDKHEELFCFHFHWVWIDPEFKTGASVAPQRIFILKINFENTNVNFKSFL